jgi:separase
VSALQQHDLFLYFGHGAGEQYLSAAAYRGLDRCAASLLMGCSSGRLRLAGEFEPHGPAWDYLMAGEPAA